MLGAAQSREEAEGLLSQCLQHGKGVYDTQTALSGFRTPPSPSSITTIPVGFTHLQLLPSRQAQNTARWAIGCSVLIPQRRLGPATISLQRRRNANGHRGPRLGPSPTCSPQRRRSCGG